MTRLRLFLRRQRRAWAELLSRRAPVAADVTLCPPHDPTHPAALCRCFDGVVLSQLAAAHAEHRPDCPWLAAMCTLCHGDGACSRCGGDGTEPEPPSPALFVNRDVLHRAVAQLDGAGAHAEAVALRTLLERLDGAP